MRFLSIAAVLLVSPATQGQSDGAVPVPSPEQLAAARTEAVEELVELLVKVKGGVPSVRMLVQRARTRAADPALSFVLLDRARDIATKSGNLSEAVSVVDEISGTFAIDEFDLLEQTLRGLRRTAETSDRALAFAYLDLASRAVRTGDAARGSMRVNRAITEAKKAAAAGGDIVLSGYVKAVRQELAVRGRAYRDMVSHAAKPQPGRYLCLIEGDWNKGLPLLDPENKVEKRILRVKGEATHDFESCLSIAESWLSRSGAYAARDVAEQQLVRRNLARHALSWYYRAWPMSSGIERARLIRQMDQLEDRLFAQGVSARVPGRLRFAEEGLTQLLIDGGESRVEKGKLVLRNLGPAMWATCRYAYRDIRSVTIRGGIRSAKNLNFRFAVGRFNAICNWEIQPENHFFFGQQRTHTKPPLFQPGKEHVLRIRQMGDRVVFFFDGKPVFESKGSLVEKAKSETVTVYASLRSEIFVTEILIDGDIDPYTPVTRPSRKLW